PGRRPAPGPLVGAGPARRLLRAGSGARGLPRGRGRGHGGARRAPGALTVHLYLHVPFCARRCSYCDFAIAVRREAPAADYVAAVSREWACWQREPVWTGEPLATVYFGGGTPSRLPADAVAALLARFAADRGLAPGAEVTLEANPDDVTPASAAAWRAAGVTRVSLGVQSFAPAVLAWMHRTHDAAQAER